MTERDQTMKMDGGKLMMELIPTSATRSLAKVLTYGAKKYKPNGWREVEMDRYVGALMRHFEAFRDDPLSVDEESGMLHIEHALCNVAFLNEFTHQRKDQHPVSDQMKQQLNTVTAMIHNKYK